MTVVVKGSSPFDTHHSLIVHCSQVLYDKETNHGSGHH